MTVESFAARVVPPTPSGRHPSGPDRPLLPPPIRPPRTWSAETLAAVVAAWLVLVANGGFWQQALAGRDPVAPATWGFGALVAVALFGLHYAILLAVPGRRGVRWASTVILLVAAAASHFTSAYGIHIDPNMIRNLLQTQPKEAADLIGPALLGQLLLKAAPMIALVWWVRLPWQAWIASLVRRTITLAVSLLVTIGAIAAGFPSFAALFRNQPSTRYLVTPANVVYSLARATAANVPRNAAARTPIGTDAVLAPAGSAGRKPALFVLVVGETARAANWGLNGYRRQTTPALAAIDPINFRDVTACGSDTETSLPCLFAPVGRRDYDERRIRNSESLLHVLARAGFDVRWRDNQTGCKGVCAGLPYEQIDDGRRADCQPGRCLDEHLLDGLDEQVAGSLRRPGQVIVLHTIGNHGPAYFARHSDAERVFTPTCDTTELSRCSTDQIVNSYDNALRYTDRFLAKAIDFLQRHSQTHATALLYVSDHGESLGEHGLYLHGMPYAIAPSVQTRVPMVLWLSDAFRTAAAVDEDCLRERATRPASHDHVFHTVLGLLGVSTAIRAPRYDLSQGCRPEPREDVVTALDHAGDGLASGSRPGSASEPDSPPPRPVRDDGLVATRFAPALDRDARR